MRQIDAGCIRCWDCCEFIAVGFTLEKVRADPDFPDRGFILKHWTPTELPSEKPNPAMSDKQFSNCFWYECDLLNTKTRKCRDYENRPLICKGCPGCIHGDKARLSVKAAFNIRSKEDELLVR